MGEHDLVQHGFLRNRNVTYQAMPEGTRSGDRRSFDQRRAICPAPVRTCGLGWGAARSGSGLEVDVALALLIEEESAE